MSPTFLTDPTWRRPGDGRVVIAGSPLRLFRLTDGGAELMRRIEAGEVVTDVQARFLDRFVDAGALHPVHRSSPFTPADVTVVVPAFGARPDVESLLAPGVAGVVVVDDASEPPLEVHADPRVRTIRRDVNGGPGAARNTGLALVSTPLVAFVDTDVTVTGDWLAPLLAHFTDASVAMAAPRVASAGGTGAVAHHDARHSPLDLGEVPARVQAGTRVSYVPSAALVARTDEVRALGGFDASMRSGEDVDLVWRLVDSGRRVRYEPASVVHHRPRATFGAMLHQRRSYGRSAGALAVRHPGALAPARLTGWSAAVWGLALSRRPWSALALALGTLVAFSRRFRDVSPREAVRLVLGGHLAAGRQLAEATTRAWWPLLVPLAVVARRWRGPVLLALTAPTVVDAVRRRQLQPLADLPMQTLAEGAYAAGVWEGAIAARTAAPLLPEVTTWPQRGADRGRCTPRTPTRAPHPSASDG